MEILHRSRLAAAEEVIFGFASWIERGRAGGFFDKLEWATDWVHRTTAVPSEWPVTEGEVLDGRMQAAMAALDAIDQYAAELVANLDPNEAWERLVEALQAYAELTDDEWDHRITSSWRQRYRNAHWTSVGTGEFDDS